FGTVLLGRMHDSADTMGMMGMFINTLPLRLRLHGADARELVERTQRELVELFPHELASLADAQRCSGIVGSAPLFTTLFNYRHGTTDVQGQWFSGTGIRIVAAQERTNY